jgi:PKD repeat protein
VASFVANQTNICVGSCVNFTNTSSGGPFSSTQWTFAGSDNTGLITIENPSNICYSNPGTFSVSLQVTNPNGTTSTSQQNFIVVSESVVPEINLNYPEIACSTSESILPQINSGNTAGGLFSSTIGLQINEQTGEINPTFSTPGLYTILYTVESLSCQGQPIETFESFQIDISEVTELTINQPENVSICEGETVELIAHGEFETFQWSNSSTNNSIVLSQPGFYSVLALNQNGCQGVSDTVIVDVFPLPQASFSYNQISNYVVEFTNSSTGIGNSFWSFGFGDTSSELNPSYDFPFDNVWPVTLVVNNSCGSDSVQTFVNVIKSSIDDLNLFPFDVYALNGAIILTGLSNKPQNYQVKIIDLQGKSIVNQEINVQGKWSQYLQHNSVAAGIYLISISDSTNSYQQKLFIQK